MSELMDKATLKQRFEAVKGKQEFLLNLMEQPDLGTLRLDVNQALEELEELIDEYERVMGESP